MGLDMYAFAVKATKDMPDVDFKPEENSSVELAYWRKFNHLHGWMEQLYRAKGGAKASFNCTTVRLDEKDLDNLMHAIGTDKLAHCPGFFFGGEEMYAEDVASAVRFIYKARAAIAGGMAVFYDSWW